MTRRVVVAGMAVALGLVSTVAHASSSTTHNCGHLIVSPRGDSDEFFLPTRPYNPETDILTIDAVTTSADVNFTVRMASVNPHPTTGTVLTIGFTVNHQGGTSSYFVTVDHQIDATSYQWQNNDTNQVADITGTTDPATGTYMISVPRKTIGATFRGAVLKQLGAMASQTVGINFANGGFIEQSTGPDYQYRVGYGYGCRK